MEGRGRLGDALAGAAGEALAHRLDHGPAARHHFERLGDVLAEFGQARLAAAGAGGRARYYETQTRQVGRERLARGLPPCRRSRHRGLAGGLLGRESVGGGRGFQFLELQLVLVDEALRALGALAVEGAAEPGDLQPEMGDQRRVG